MDGAAGFFWTIVVLQIVFSVAVTWLVARRWPARARAYRVAAPGALPVLLMAMVAYSYTSTQHAQGLTVQPEVLGRFALAYLVLWLVGMLAAGIVVRRVRR